MMKKGARWRTGVLALLLAAASGPAAAESFELGGDARLSVNGYLRQWMSFNLNDMPETPDNDRWRVSMARSQLRLDTTLTMPGVKFFASGRGVAEAETGWQRDLERMGANGGHDLMRKYNALELREAWAESAFDRLTLRLGKQQVVWGETDFFVASDMVHGFDYSWRAMLETENEELRKPLILANAIVQIPEADGSLQAFVRPGLDRGRDIGNTFDTWGGRWSPQPYRGFWRDGLVGRDARHPDGDVRDPTYGVRWRGLAGDVNYSLLHLRTFRPDPIVNPAVNPVGGRQPAGLLGDDYHPVVNVYGATASGYAPPVDAVLSAEVAYIPNMPYNFDSLGGTGLYPGFLAGLLPPNAVGVRKTDLVRWMLRSDFNVDLRSVLGTDGTSFLSFQLFDSWHPNLKGSDNLLYWPGFQTKLKEHAFTLTGVLQLSYLNDTVKPGLAAGWDISYGGGFVIPSIDYIVGDHLRLRAEADFFFAKRAQRSQAAASDQVGFISFFDNNSQFVLRATYQF
ncbi:DUF1302 family protein [Azospirillum sp. TSO22-1]|uniref:DUF1302 family protein n=1 Tax=Azospirillum sp. TSO22-1 TaxID=716789 RepID=UPI000D604223|nr:DUF1302 family protein [Azospirillum sp. TSO22-1]PWC52533.1 hypothetical protein TSO221_13855 [Azospirillum sp. TSO22-1]